MGNTCCCFTVANNEVAIIQRFGKFKETSFPGLHFLNCFCGEEIAGRVSLQTQMVTMSTETKTHDNVFVTLHVSVQYQVIRTEVQSAFYSLNQPIEQLKSLIQHTIRSTVPSLTLDDVFLQKDHIAQEVQEDLAKKMEQFGYRVLDVLVNDIVPDKGVMHAMNEINAAERQLVAAKSKGEINKMMSIMKAEAEAETMYLEGVGVARQRKAIVDGLRESIDEFTKAVSGADAHDAMSLILMTQYFDAIKEIGGSSRNSTIFIPHQPGGVSDIANQLRMLSVLSENPANLMEAQQHQQHIRLPPPSASGAPTN